MPRSNGRKDDELRPIRLTRNYLDFAEGSVLAEFGKTRVLVAVSVTDSVPNFLLDRHQGWLTAEYSMLPMSVPDRIARGKTGGRASEIQRLIGRSLRAVVDLAAFGERTLQIDCDVIQADGGTRTASITGAYVALHDAFRKMDHQGLLSKWPIRCGVAAVSVGIIGGRMLLDLDYTEDSQASVDLNVVMTDQGEYVEVQGTAESNPFSRDKLDSLLATASAGIQSLFRIQADVIQGDLSGERIL